MKSFAYWNIAAKPMRQLSFWYDFFKFLFELLFNWNSFTYKIIRILTQFSRMFYQPFNQRCIFGMLN